jgi:hypothetical protein
LVTKKIRCSSEHPLPFSTWAEASGVETVTGLLVLLAVMLTVSVPVLAIRRLRDESASMMPPPDDLRRADDGGGPNEAGGPGLGPMWPQG